MSGKFYLTKSDIVWLVLTVIAVGCVVTGVVGVCVNYVYVDDIIGLRLEYSITELRDYQYNMQVVYGIDDFNHLGGLIAWAVVSIVLSALSAAALTESLIRRRSREKLTVIKTLIYTATFLSSIIAFVYATTFEDLSEMPWGPSAGAWMVFISGMVCSIAGFISLPKCYDFIMEMLR